MKYRRYNRYLRSKDIARHGNNRRLSDVVQEEVEREWRGGVDKRKNKPSTLKIKNSTPTIIWRGIVIVDKALDEKDLC